MKKIIFLLSMVLFHSSWTLFTHIEVLSNGKQTLYLLSDWHDDIEGGAATLQQHKDLLWALAQKKSVFLIAEDNTTTHKKFFIKHNLPFAVGGKNDTPNKFPDSIDHFIKNYDWSMNQHQQSGQHYIVSPLCYLTHFAKQLPNMVVHNVEPDTMTRVLIAPNDKLEIVESLHHYVEKLSPKCEAYRSFLKEGIKMCDTISTAEEFRNHIGQVRKYLVDARILNSLLKCQDLSYGFIAAGAAHIDNARFNMLNTGYRSILTFGISNDIVAAREHEEEFIVNNRLDIKTTFEKIFSVHTSKDS